MLRYLKLFLPLLFLSTAPWIEARQEPATSAWDELTNHHPRLFHRVALPLERELLQQLSPQELEAFLDGTSPDLITLKSGESLSGFLDRKSLGLFEIPWFSIDGGGGKSSGETFALSGTAGQPDASFAQGGTFQIYGGFKAARLSIALFADGFESGDLSNWTSTNP